MSAVDQFPVLLSEAEEESSAVPPCFSHEGINVCGIMSMVRASSVRTDHSPLLSTCTYDTTTSTFLPSRNETRMPPKSSSSSTRLSKSSPNTSRS